ncbi:MULTISPECIES: AfsR/SARP family transcriptional regulator [unclassified Streptomyces]|uniref:AfsR/SARP family transcriptional regulator n=1 Tax=unclassified Streptomyces TaxID=2593676 RepID=UPI0011A052D9|nr:AfsR/SARP family transcriptional regulator [Streptomyces sp. BK340]TVZ80507.1 DNA-binding SARP family transcriptional activator [Streptomyces sp. BK340]
MHFDILGPLKVTTDQRDYTPSAAKTRQVLALLLLRSGQTLSLDSIVEELWGENPPRSAVTTSQTYIYQLRKAFAGQSWGDSDGQVISTVSPGYVLRTEGSRIDVREFERLVAEGQTLLSLGQATQSVEALNRALALWRGPALSNVDKGPLLGAYVAHLEERRIAALELRVSAEMERGNHRGVIADLRKLVAAHPYNEWFHSQLIAALNMAGRRVEALQAYQTIRLLLSEELGLDPSPDLQRIHHEVLSGSAVMSSRAA